MPINKILAFFKFDKHLTRKLTLYLVILATISAITTYITITSISSPLGTNSVLVTVLALFDLILFQSFSNVTYYDYPNEDFCNFKHFPHHRFVLPELRPAYKSQQSCTELYLIQYSFKYEYHLNQRADYLLNLYSYLML
jgi:hypothetical protein